MDETERIEAWLGTIRQNAQASERPLVTLSYAQSLDGSLTTRRGQSFPISGQASLALTHRLRACHQAILVGVGTVLADDPRLTVRLVPGPSPQPVILDTQLCTPPDSRLFQEKRDQPVLIATTPPLHSGRAAALRAVGAELLSLPAGERSGIAIPALLSNLSGRSIRTLMVEGGARVITTFLQEGLVDYVILTLAPVFLGGLTAVENRLSQPYPRLENPGVTLIGGDVVLWGAVAGKTS